jgi:hypothetical protein
MRLLKSAFFLLILAACTVGFYAAFSGGQWPRLPEWRKHHPKAPSVIPPGQIAPSGGKFFFSKVTIPVAILQQSDKAWGKDALAWGQNGDTIASHGCALTSAAMIMQTYGLKTDPKALNAMLIRNKGYTAEGWLMWERVPDLAPGHVKFVYEGPPSYPLIDSNLQQGNPVIVRIRYPQNPDGTPGITHFVVICGKEGLDYLIADPGRAGSRGIYPLKEFGSNIEALRYYERIVPPRAIPVVGS